ncbi:MAG: arginyltransferase [Alphaproteobacteria bacterium]|nr:arginyltransferase [Alphaproteobacteria bacterium]
MKHPPNPQNAPQGVLVDQTPHACPYLEGRTAVLPLRWYPERIGPDDFDELLAQADRRVGRTLYHPACPSCSACQGIRVPIEDFAFSRSQRRTWKRNMDLRVVAGPPLVDKHRVRLFNKHKLSRSLGERAISQSRYRDWLAVSCADTIETRYMLGDKLLAVGILDLGRRDASSVYFYFDPDVSERRLGVFSVLAEIAWLKRNGYRHYYLGLYVADCAQLSYKATYFPHERLVEGRWWRYDARGAAPTAVDQP